MKKLICLLMSICMIFLAGCHKSGTEAALRFDILHMPVSIDPQITKEDESQLILLNTMVGLTKITSYGEIISGCAENWTISPNGKVYEFKLKNNLQWEDGSALTANDFSFAFKRLADPITHSPFSEKYMNIENFSAIQKGELSPDKLGVFAKDSSTLVINLIKPDASFLSLMSQSSSLPCNSKFFYETKGKYGIGPTKFLSNGPYKITSLQTDLITLEKNDKSPFAANVEKLYICLGRGENISLFISGRSEACIVPFERKSEIIADTSSALFDSSFALMINPMSTIGENKALRKSLVETAVNENLFEKLPLTVKKADGIIPPTVAILDKNYRKTAGEIVAYNTISNSQLKTLFFNELIDKGKTKLPKTSLLTLSSEPNFSLASRMQNIWSKSLSSYINIEQLTEFEISQKLLNNDYQLALAPIKTSQTSVWEYLNYFNQCTINFDETQMTVAEALAHIKEQSNANELATQYKKVEQALVDEYYVLPLYFAPTFFVVSSNINGIEYIPSKRSVYFGNAVFLK